MNIANGNSQNAISILSTELEKNNDKNINELTVLSGRYSTLNKDHRKGTISKSELNLETVKINYAILCLLDELENKDSSENKDSQLSKAFDKFKLLVKSYNIVEKKGNFKSRENVLEIPDLMNFQSSIEYHTKVISNWSKTISFKDLKTTKNTNKIYVDLDFYLIPRKFCIEDSSVGELINIKDIYNISDQNIVILGQPGAGKTTTMKMIVNWCLKNEASPFLDFQFPLVVRLRELNEGLVSNGIFEKIFEIIGIPILDRENYERKASIFRNLLINLIDDLNILIILDGFDELKPKLKEKFILDICQFTNGLSNSKFILTSRTGDFNDSIENTKEFEISPLNQNQIKKFISNWLQDESKSKDLYSQIKNSPFSDTAIRPLTLSHLCALYERYLKIPEKPKTVYKKIVNLLIEEWDLQRGITREGSKYSTEFEVDRKFEFLSHLAYYLTTQYNRTTFKSKELSKAYLGICNNFGLPKNEKKKIVEEIESHTGIFLQSGYDKFEFAHKSIQEYLAAEYFVKLPQIPNGTEILKIPSEVALAVALSSNSNLYFTTLIFNKLIKLNFSLSFCNSFLDRIIIEKPDFYPNPSLGISSIALYSICFYRFSSKKKEFKKWASFFERFISIPSIRESIDELQKYYAPYIDEVFSINEIYDISYIYGISNSDVRKFLDLRKIKEIKLLFRNPRTALEANIPNPQILLFDEKLLNWK